ncbi:MAG TPA: TIGR00282 family metallophosphoesterase [Firmicutes bacterium]|nr:TIGR00282 family metallophosphoesterase [Bacillota bacterium]
MKILFVGDIVGRPGRACAKQVLSEMRSKHNYDLTIANAENAAGGNGLTSQVCRELFDMGLDVLTLGNHAWDKKEIFQFIDNEPGLVRPLNYPPEVPGQGMVVVHTAKAPVAVINACGRVFNPTLLECPFRALERAIHSVRKETNHIIVDFHAEATSEKVAMGWFLDGKVSAVLGTHTHVQTADDRILPGGTAYITDAGMTGPRDSVIGISTDLVLKRFLSQLPVRFEVARGATQFCAVEIEIDDDTGHAVSIRRIFRVQESLITKKS